MLSWPSARGLLIGIGAAVVVPSVAIPILASGQRSESDFFVPSNSTSLPPTPVATAVGQQPAQAGSAAIHGVPISVNGGASVVVSQAITLDTDYVMGENPSALADKWVSTRNPEGTAFTAALELKQGELGKIRIFLENHSGADAAAVLELRPPPGFDVEVSDKGRVTEAQMTQSTWLLLVPATVGAGTDRGDDGVVICIQPRGDIKPGFYAIAGTLYPKVG